MGKRSDENEFDIIPLLLAVLLIIAAWLLFPGFYNAAK